MDKGARQFDNDGGNQNKKQNKKQTSRSEKNKPNEKQRKKGMETEIKGLKILTMRSQNWG